jgi:4-amino-4-deoxy-L-arabinose transferase-like glycosyltransferase
MFFFLPFLGKVHLFDWDEINFAESAREMIVSGNYGRVQIDFKPFWEKPPLFFWMQALCMHLFGVTEFAARLPNAIMGIISILSFYFIGKKLKDSTFGLIWALSYLGSFLPHLYFKSGIIDPTFNYFIFLSLYLLYLSIIADNKNKSLVFAILAGILLGLATLTKGPVGILIVSITFLGYWISIRFRKFTSILNITLFVFSLLLVSSLWFGLEMIKNGPWFISEFFKYQVNLLLTPVAGHQQPFYYHFIVVFLGCFPISIWALPALFKGKLASSNNPVFHKLMLILFWVVMILFSIVKTKIVHYSSLSYFPLSFLAATFIYSVVLKTVEIKRYLILLLSIVGAVFSLLLIMVPLLAKFKELIIPFIKDKFAVACLNSSVEWSGFEFLIGFFYLVFLVISIYKILKGNFFSGVVMMFYSTAFCMFFYLVEVVPKIEKYSQASAVNFYQSLSGKDVYVIPVGFKSYAHYYYFKKQPNQRKEADSEDWLINGPIDKPAYFVAKITNKDYFDGKPTCKLLKQEGGFLFYKRTPPLNLNETSY